MRLKKINDLLHECEYHEPEAIDAFEPSIELEFNDIFKNDTLTSANNNISSSLPSSTSSNFFQGGGNINEKRNSVPNKESKQFLSTNSWLENLSSRLFSAN